MPRFVIYTTVAFFLCIGKLRHKGTEAQRLGIACGDAVLCWIPALAGMTRGRILLIGIGIMAGNLEKVSHDNFRCFKEFNKFWMFTRKLLKDFSYPGNNLFNFPGD